MSWAPDVGSLRISALLPLYRSKQLTPTRVIEAIHQRFTAAGDDCVWISQVPLTELRKRAAQLEAGSPELPLYGVPFAVKDNIDVAGMPTTAACPVYASVAEKSAPVVEALLAAGAILVGKSNMDQFATGLVGVRSPYGVPRNPFDERFIPGGSSSGSAVSVSANLVSFALGTDTAGSGRVPAGFNNIVGWKPTPGIISTDGVVPACRSLDCVSVFALTCGDAAVVGQVLGDVRSASAVGTFRFGVPASTGLKFFGNPETPGLFETSIERLIDLGGTAVEIDFAPLQEAARLLYEGPWVAERTAALQTFLDAHGGDMLEVTRSIVEGGKKYSAAQAFSAMYRLSDLQKQIAPMWQNIDVLLLPTAGTTYTVEEVAADPVVKNSNLGYYTNFVNLLGYAALAVPSGFDSRGLPFGVTLIGQGRSDSYLLRLGDRIQRCSALPLGATKEVLASRGQMDRTRSIVAVVGAHLRGLPLNSQLTERDGTFVRKCRTAPSYKFFELPNSTPPKPGLARVNEGGSAIEVELWELPTSKFGEFVDLIPPPLGIGSLVLDTGEIVKGFICEAVALEAARDITSFGGWRNFMQSKTR
ncbi:MAG: allophanate hydrolase [Bryobacteraceae bacterium]